MDVLCPLVFGFTKVGSGMGFFNFCPFLGLGIGPLRGLTASSVDVISSVGRYQ